MIARCGVLTGVAVAVLSASVAGVRAQAPAPPPEKGTVSGNGTVVLNRKPELMRMRVDVIAQGKSMKEALASLKDRRQAILGQLAKLGAAKESVAFGTPQVNATVLQARQQMAMMIMARMGNRSKKNQKKAAAPVVISARLTAEWPLKGKDAEELLIEISELQEAINAADLAGKKDLEKLSGEDEEISQELAGMEQNMGNDPNQGQPGTPSFTLISKVSAQEHTQALAEAYSKATTQAQETAKAAGAQLGSLRQLRALIQASGDGDNGENPMQAYYRMMQFGGGGGAVAAEPDSRQEAQGTQPGEVVYRVTVNAAFDLK